MCQDFLRFALLCLALLLLLLRFAFFSFLLSVSLCFAFLILYGCWEYFGKIRRYFPSDLKATLQQNQQRIKAKMIKIYSSKETHSFI